MCAARVETRLNLERLRRPEHVLELARKRERNNKLVLTEQYKRATFPANKGLGHVRPFYRTNKTTLHCLVSINNPTKILNRQFLIGT